MDRLNYTKKYFLKLGCLKQKKRLRFHFLCTLFLSQDYLLLLQTLSLFTQLKAAAY